jgi:hypothetical protein
MAVTILKTRNNVNGSLREKYINLNIGANLDTYNTQFKQIIAVDSNNPGAITSITFSGGTLTFNTTGAVNNVFLRVTALT